MIFSGYDTLPSNSSVDMLGFIGFYMKIIGDGECECENRFSTSFKPTSADRRNQFYFLSLHYSYSSFRQSCILCPMLCNRSQRP
jgi:hypothetical protein